MLRTLLYRGMFSLKCKLVTQSSGDEDNSCRPESALTVKGSREKITKQGSDPHVLKTLVWDVVTAGHPRDGLFRFDGVKRHI